MPHIHQIGHEESTGALRREFDKAMKRAGRIWNIVAIMSQNPEALRDSIRFYSTIMFGESPLSRVQREMLAVVTSQVNECVY